MKLLLSILCVLSLGLVGIFFFGKLSAERVLRELYLKLDEPPSNSHYVEYKSLDKLPAPVARYFRYALRDGQGLIANVSLTQSGSLRTDLKSSNWMQFSAIHRVVPHVPGFVWNAKVSVFGPFYVRVFDSYIHGVGSGLVKIMSIYTVGQDQNNPPMNSGALHRYLAETPWYPTALLPESGVKWNPIDENRALATISDRGTTVSLEFRFRSNGEIAGIFTPERWGSFDGGYSQRPWEGRFSDYQEIQGMRVPSKGEVGWYEQGRLESVWKGTLIEANYSFDRNPR